MSSRYASVCLAALLMLGALSTARAQALETAITVDDRVDVHPISPLIYGVNNSSNPSANLASRRQGGDRYTTYNWENNASNSGHWTDDPAQVHLNHTSDANVTGYVPSNIPAKAITDFHDASNANGIYSVVTLQAGHVARDLNGPVAPNEAVPNLARWRTVKFDKGSQLELQPNVDDEFVYMDELLNFLLTKYGDARSSTGIKGYGISNEPGLWNRVHPRSHPTKEGIQDIIDVSVGLASTIKRMDPFAEVYGGVTYGFSEMKDFDGAPDRATFAQHKWYIDALLAAMRTASTAAGRTLMDVLDVHWYSEAEGSQQYVPVAWAETNSPDIVAARVQAPRSLWDPTYVEKSWITGAPGRYSHTNEIFNTQSIALIPRLRESIAANNQGVQIAFGEFGYGGYDHISGGIAVADALGIFGRESVYYANHWDDLTGYVETAYKLYRNYDGLRSTFGEMSVKASTSDVENNSVYASTNQAGDSLHVMVINKNPQRSMRATITINSNTKWGTGYVYGMSDRTNVVRFNGTIDAFNNVVTRELDALEAWHIVFVPERATGAPSSERNVSAASIAPTPCVDNAVLTLVNPVRGEVDVEVIDALGRSVLHQSHEPSISQQLRIPIDTRALATGRYTALVRVAGATSSLPLIITR